MAVRIYDTVFATVPAFLVPMLADWPAARLFDVPALIDAVGPKAVLRAHAHLLYADATTLSTTSSLASPLAHDDARLEAFARSMPTDEWEEAGLSRATNLACQFAVPETGPLAAVAGYELWDDSIAHVCIASSPEYRGRGLAKVVGITAATAATRSGMIPQWRASMLNPASFALGTAIGFIPVGEQLVIRVS